MNTKEAIKFINVTMYNSEQIREDIIDLLERGSKHEAMWGELEHISMKNSSYSDIYIKIGNLMKDIKERYFPKRSPYFFEDTLKDPHLKKVPFKGR